MTQYWIAISIAIGCNVVANVCLKRLALASTGEEASLATLLMKPELFLLGLSGAGLLAAYAYAIRGLSLPVSYTVVTAGAMVLLLVVSAQFFDTNISKANLAGAVLVIAGIALLTR